MSQCGKNRQTEFKQVGHVLSRCFLDAGSMLTWVLERLGFVRAPLTSGAHNKLKYFKIK